MPNTTPTNALIEETAELYIMLMTELNIPASALVLDTDKPRRTVVTFDAGNCLAVGNASVFWHEAIASPLMVAHYAAHQLEEVTARRAKSNATPNSPYAAACRHEVKRLRALIASKDAEIRRELAKLRDMLISGI